MEFRRTFSTRNPKNVVIRGLIKKRDFLLRTRTAHGEKLCDNAGGSWTVSVLPGFVKT